MAKRANKQEAGRAKRPVGRNVFWQAAGLIERYGWTQRRAGDKEQGYCMMGALWRTNRLGGLWETKEGTEVVCNQLSLAQPFVFVGLQPYHLRYRLININDYYLSNPTEAIVFMSLLACLMDDAQAEVGAKGAKR